MDNITTIWRISQRLIRNNSTKLNALLSEMRTQLEEEFEGANLQTHIEEFQPTPALMFVIQDITEQLRSAVLMKLLTPSKILTKLKE